jgi:hypothetical protein
VIVAAAGRRIDSEDAVQRRFPLENVDRVREAIRKALREIGATTVVGSAACGADLLVAEAALELDCELYTILPFEAEKFRQVSVMDRPGQWGASFDRLIRRGAAAGHLRILETTGTEHEAYERVNEEILAEADALGKQRQEAVTALPVWDGKSRGSDDLTEHFIQSAMKRELKVVPVLTI